MRDNIKSVPYDCPIDVDKMHGHMTITLTDVKTGKQKVIEEDNMMTDAIKEYFRNCGFMNYPNLSKDNLVETLLGGIIGLDTALDEDATLLHVPAGVEMIFNGAVGTTNTGTTPSELGTCSTAVVSGEPDTGWQSNGDYKITLDFTTEQGNCKTGKQICCVCLCNKAYGHAGEGNAKSLVRFSTKSNISNILGSTSDAVSSGIAGRVFDINFAMSTCSAFNIEEVEEEQEGETVTVKKGFMRTYRLPISKLNLKGTRTAPILLDEQIITIDEDMKNADNLQWQPFQGEDFAELLMWNAPKRTAGGYGPNKIWGSDFTQYLWTLTAEGTLTKQTVTNTSGISNMQGLGAAYFDGNYCFFPKTYCEQNPSYAYWRQRVDTRTIIVWDRSTNAMSVMNNPYGVDYVLQSYVTDVRDFFYNCQWGGWVFHHGTGDGRIYLYANGTNNSNYGFIIDVTKGTIYPHNATGDPIVRLFDVWGYDGEDFIQSLIRCSGVNLYRDQSYIATINNLAEPVAKDNSKTMKVVYRISFNEEEESNA